jgi:hypothetical protein
MENIILSEQEIRLKVAHELLKKPDNVKVTTVEIIDTMNIVALKAQRKLLRILKEPCSEHRILQASSYNDATRTVSIVQSIALERKRKDCPACLAEIEKEIER